MSKIAEGSLVYKYLGRPGYSLNMSYANSATRCKSRCGDFQAMDYKWIERKEMGFPANFAKTETVRTFWPSHILFSLREDLIMIFL